jgi:putative transposase
LPKVPQHIVQRGNNRQAPFFHDDDYCADLEYLREALLENQCKLFVFVLMTHHVHLLALGAGPGAISGLMQSV